MPRRTGSKKKSADSDSLVSPVKKNEVDAFIRLMVEEMEAKKGSPENIDKKFAKVLSVVGKHKDAYRVLSENLDREFVTAYIDKVEEEYPDGARGVSSEKPVRKEEEEPLIDSVEEEEEDEEDYEDDEDEDEEADPCPFNQEWPSKEDEEWPTEAVLGSAWALAIMRVPASSFWSLGAVNKRTFSLITSSAFQQARTSSGHSMQELIVVFGDNGFSETPSSACVALYNRNDTGWKHRPLATMGKSVSWGCAPTLACKGQFYLVSGNQDGLASRAFLSYSLSEDVWRPAPPLPEARHFSVCSVIKGNLIVAGGQLPQTGVTATTLEFNTSMQRWTELPDMPYAVASAQAGAIRNRMYVAGGFGAYTPEVRLAEFNYSSQTWSLHTDMPEPRNKGAAVIFLRKLVVLGGYGQDCGPSDSMYIYNPSGDKWVSGPTLPEPCVHCHAATVGGTILLVRGSDDLYKKTTKPPFILDTQSGRWSKLDRLPHAAPVAALAVLSKG